MAYSSKISPSAKQALQACFKTYNQRDEMMAWLNGLVSMAENKQSERVSIDLGDVFPDWNKMEMPSEEALNDQNWRATWEFFKASGVMKKIAAIMKIMAGRVPVELRYSSQIFSYLTGAVTEEVAVYYEVNHVENCVIFRTFSDLPGGDFPEDL